MRNLIWYIYKSIMRWVTGIFVQIDPIGVLKSYIDDLKDNLSKMNVQIGKLRGQMSQLKSIMDQNKKDIENNLKLASAAQNHDMGGENTEVQAIVKGLEAAKFQGDTTVQIDGGTVKVSRMGDSTMVRVEMREVEEEEAHEHAH